jgi:6-pyruvoyltetrahydropterin/6-carboxytetrahydropterin synthase
MEGGWETGRFKDPIPNLPYHPPMPITRKVTVKRNRLRFAAAHRPPSEVAANLCTATTTTCSWRSRATSRRIPVWDFGDLKRSTKAIVDELDHKFLLQRESRVLQVEQQEGAWVVAFAERRYVFPASDVVALPIDNSTAERLAEWVGGRLLSYLRESGAASLQRLTVGIEEMPGQAGWYIVEL